MLRQRNKNWVICLTTSKISGLGAPTFPALITARNLLAPFQTCSVAKFLCLSVSRESRSQRDGVWCTAFETPTTPQLSSKMWMPSTLTASVKSEERTKRDASTISPSAVVSGPAWASSSPPSSFVSLQSSWPAPAALSWQPGSSPAWSRYPWSTLSMGWRSSSMAWTPTRMRSWPSRKSCWEQLFEGQMSKGGWVRSWGRRLTEGTEEFQSYFFFSTFCSAKLEVPFQTKREAEVFVSCYNWWWSGLSSEKGRSCQKSS